MRRGKSLVVRASVWSSMSTYMKKQCEEAAALEAKDADAGRQAWIDIDKQVPGARMAYLEEMRLLEALVSTPTRWTSSAPTTPTRRSARCSMSKIMSTSDDPAISSPLRIRISFDSLIHSFGQPFGDCTLCSRSSSHAICPRTLIISCLCLSTSISFFCWYSSALFCASLICSRKSSSMKERNLKSFGLLAALSMFLHRSLMSVEVRAETPRTAPSESPPTPRTRT